MGLASNLDTRQSLVNDIHDFDDEGFYWLILSRQQSMASNGSRCAVNGTCGTCVCGHKSEQDMEGSTDDRQPPEKVIQEFWHQQHIGEAPDFVIELEKNNIPCHKSILRKASSYFEALFSSQMKECENNRVKLIDTHVHDFMSLMKFAYTGQLDISKETVFSVTALANMYQFNSALKFAQKFLVSQVASETWREILQFSELHDLKDVHYVAFRYVLWNFSKEVKSEIENFQVLSKTSLEKLLGHPLLNCTSESEVVQVLSAWCDYDEKRTQEVFADVFFSTVYLNELTAEELDAILNLKWVQNNSAVKKFVEETAVNEISANASSQSKPVCKKTRAGPLVLLCVGGDLNLGENNCAIQMYIQDRHDQCETMGLKRLPLACVCADTDLYVIGGETVLGRNTWQTDIWKYSSFSSTWSLATQLQQPRRHHGICTLGGEIYLIGGIGRFRQVLNSVEKYNPQTDEMFIDF
ncbi:kelch-like protein 1 [Liolophura sinensis]|uniref:kelch-like protein 1 n=1 Tax=Liolophura sinensis TaxID=3198878 RepID=UPI003157FFE8